MPAGNGAAMRRRGTSGGGATPREVGGGRRQSSGVTSVPPRGAWRWRWPRCPPRRSSRSPRPGCGCVSRPCCCVPAPRACHHLERALLLPSSQSSGVDIRRAERWIQRRRSSFRAARSSRAAMERGGAAVRAPGEAAVRALSGAAAGDGGSPDLLLSSARLRQIPLPSPRRRLFWATTTSSGVAVVRMTNPGYSLTKNVCPILAPRSSLGHGSV